LRTGVSANLQALTKPSFGMEFAPVWVAHVVEDRSYGLSPFARRVL
jgi:hypothetical protein